jgi:putative SOS response-associated peptidase YedK
MPVLLTNSEQYDRWLDPQITERRLLEEVIRPLGDGDLSYYSALVGLASRNRSSLRQASSAVNRCLTCPQLGHSMAIK